MSNQNIKSDLLEELSTEEQQLLSGGNRLGSGGLRRPRRIGLRRPHGRWW